MKLCKTHEKIVCYRSTEIYTTTTPVVPITMWLISHRVSPANSLVIKNHVVISFEKRIYLRNTPCLLLVLRKVNKFLHLVVWNGSSLCQFERWILSPCYTQTQKSKIRPHYKIQLLPSMSVVLTSWLSALLNFTYCQCTFVCSQSKILFLNCSTQLVPPLCSKCTVCFKEYLLKLTSH